MSRPQDGARERGRNGIAPRPAHERLAERLTPTATGCLIYGGALDRKGYARVTAHTPSGKRSLPAHRVAYEAAHGPIPPGLHIDHLCRNKACCNPDHLEAVSASAARPRALPPTSQPSEKEKKMTEFADNLVRIEALLYIPATLVDDESFPPLFKEFCDDLPERKSSQIYKKIPLLKGLDSGADEFDVADRLMRASASGFLLNAATPARNYHSAGRGFTWSWGDYWCEWLYAADAGLIQSVAVAWAQARAASDKLQAA